MINLTFKKPVSKADIHDSSNTDLIIALCKLTSYGYNNNMRITVERICSELESRGLVYDDFYHEWQVELNA